MTETGLPTYLNRGLSLSHAELCTQLGAELLSLCQSVTADGRLTPEELDGLRQWLREAETAEMPAAKHLRGVIRKVLADGKITPDEYNEVHRAVEAALPFDDRRQAMSARLEVEAAESATRIASGSERRPAVLRIGAVIALAVVLAAASAWLLA
jgi:uncharacterized membrane protein